MKITIATGPSFPVPALLGGAIPRIWQGLAEEFVRRGHSVCIVARAFSGQPREEIFNGVRYFRHGGFSQGLNIVLDLAKDLIYAASVVKRMPDADILVTNDFWLPVLAGWLRGRAGKIVINAGRFPKGQFRLYGRAARIAAVSAAVRNAIVKECPSLASRTRVLPNPINTHLLRPNAAAKAGGQPVLLFVGRLHPEKGVHLLVEAFRRLHEKHGDWRLQIVGPIAKEQGGGGIAYEQQLKTLTQDLPVEFLSAIFDLGKLAEIYRAATLFCYPSLAEKGESFGVAPLEAMACGVPAVVSALECFQDFIVEGNNGWIFDHRCDDPVDALAKKLDEVMSEPALIAEAGARAAVTAGQFSYEAVAERYLADFAELLQNHS